MITFLSDMWSWLSNDLFGSVLIAVVVLVVISFGLLYSINIPNRVSVAFMVPLALGLITLGWVGWFGWIIISVAGISFGLLIYLLYEGR